MFSWSFVREQQKIYLFLSTWVCFESGSTILNRRFVQKSEPKETHCFWFSHYPWMTGVGKDLWMSPGPILCSGTATYTLRSCLDGFGWSPRMEISSPPPRQPLPVLSLSQWKSIAQYLEGTSCVSDHVHWLCTQGKDPFSLQCFRYSYTFLRSPLNFLSSIKVANHRLKYE